MEDNNNNKKEKLGNILELLNNSVKNKDMKNTLKAFKIIKQNNYSVYIEPNNKFNKDVYNNFDLVIKDDDINEEYYYLNKLNSS